MGRLHAASSERASKIAKSFFDGTAISLGYLHNKTNELFYLFQELIFSLSFLLRMSIIILVLD